MKPTTTTTEKKQYTPVWELPTIEEELTLCKRVRFYSVRAMDNSHGEHSALTDIRHGFYTDEVWKDTESRAEAIATLTSTKNTKRAQAHGAKDTAQDLTKSAEDRAEAERLHTLYTTQADSDLYEIKDIEAIDNTITATLAEDMLIHIWLELQAIKADPNRQTEEAFGQLCKAGREFIESLSSVSILDKMTTYSRPLSREEAVYYMTRYNADPAQRPRAKWYNKHSYYTLEALERKKDLDPAKVDPGKIANYARYNESCLWFYENITLPTTYSASASYTINEKGEAVKAVEQYQTVYPALSAKTIASHFWHRQTTTEKVASLGLDPTEDKVLYLVLHVPTIRAEYTTEHLSDKDPRTAEAVTESVLSAVDVIRLAEKANLSTQARTTVSALCSPEAVKQARTAYNVAMEAGKTSLEEQQARRATEGKKKLTPGRIRQLVKQYTDHANEVYKLTLWDYALEVAEYAEASRPKAKHTIIKKLTKAYYEAPDELTPGHIDYTALMRGSYRGQAKPQSVVDALRWTATAPKANHKPVVRFTDSGLTPEALTPGEDYRASLVIYLDSQRSTAPKATPPARSAREQSQYEALCKRESELSELWKAFQKGEPIPAHIAERKPTKATKETAVFELINQRWTARQPKNAEASASVFLMDARNANPLQLAKVAIDAVVMTKHGTGKIKAISGDVITVKMGRSATHHFNAPIAIANKTITIL